MAVESDEDEPRCVEGGEGEASEAKDAFDQMPAFAAVEVLNAEHHFWRVTQHLSGVVIGAPSALTVEITVGDHRRNVPIAAADFEERSAGRPRACWAAQIEDVEGAPQNATVRLCAEKEVCDEVSIPASRFVSIGQPKIVVSALEHDPVSEIVRLHGWWGGAVKSPRVKICLHGGVVGVARLGLPREDVRKAQPALSRSDLGWTFSGKVTGVAELVGALEVRLYDGRRLVQSVEAVVEPRTGARKAALQRVLSARVAEKVSLMTEKRLRRIVRSRGLARRCYVPDLYGRLASETRKQIGRRIIESASVRNDLEMRLFNGSILFANPWTDEVIARAFLLRAAYERGLLEWVAANTAAGDTVIDVGAAYGMVSIAAAQRGARVVAVDANPDAVGYLERNIRLNDCSRIEVVETAISDGGESTLTFVKLPGNAGGSYVSFDGTPRNEILTVLSSTGDTVAYEHKRRGHSIDVRAMSLDDLCTQRELRDVRFVKMDIEGAELSALKGAAGLLAGTFGAPPIFVLEVSDIVPIYGGEKSDVYEFFWARGWTAWKQKNGKERGGPLIEIRSLEAAPRHDNIHFIPPSHSAPPSL